MPELNPPVGGRTIALFPGAFKPPHVNHFETVRYLAQRGDIDEVVVIIANRSRPIPGSTKALGVDVAKRVWAVYLRHLTNVRVEVAAASAVAHAVDLVDRLRPGDNVLLVLGKEDTTAGRSRFGKLRSREPPSGVTVSIIEGSADIAPVRATQLRAHLAGDRGRADLVAGLPTQLSNAERDEVWTICRQAMVDQRELSLGRIEAVLEERGFCLRSPLVAVTPGKRDEVFRANLTSGVTAFIKDANDTISAATGSGCEPKPRRRLKAEREAVKWLQRNVATSVQVPEILFYDRSTRTLALTEVCADGRSLATDLRVGRFDPSVASRAGRFLVAVHNSTNCPPPFWDDPVRDLQQWRRMLCTRTTGDLFEELPSRLQARLEDLRDASDAARSPGFRHLDFSSSNLIVNGDQIGVVDFESSANIGDPAYDLGTLLAGYLVAAIDVGGTDASRAALLAALAGYRVGAGARWESMATRVVGFTAASLVYEHRHSAHQHSAHQRSAHQGHAGQPSAVVDERVVAIADHLLSTSDEIPSRKASVVLTEAMGLRYSAKPNPDQRGAAESGPSRTVRRRWLKSREPGTQWEGSVMSTGDRDDLTIEILGGEPRTVVDVHLDGTRIGAVDLDALGSAELRFSTGGGGSRVEVRSNARVVLDGTSPSKTRG